MKFSDLEGVYQKWLHLDHDPHLVKLCYAFHIANQFDGNPVWANLIGPAGSGKTQILMSMQKAESIMAVSTLSPAALLSGYSDDSSLLPQLNDRTLIVEDLSAILELPKETRGQMFSFLRSAYNGEFTRATGRGKIEWKGKFGMLCGTTNAIEIAKSRESLLGERFLNIRLRITPSTERKMMDRALTHTLQKRVMNTELEDAAASFLDNFKVDRNNREMDDSRLRLIHNCAIALSRARSAVMRDFHHRDDIIFPVEAGELGTRLASQFIMLVLAARSLGFPDTEVTELLYRIMLDTIPLIRLQTLRAIHRGYNRRSKVCRELRMSENPMARELQDLECLGILAKKKGGYYSIAHDVISEGLEIIG